MNSNINNSTKNVIFYVDGLNLYYGLKHNGWKKYYWLNISKFCCCFLKYYQKPVAIKYFNAPPKENQKKIKRYNKFISANETESLFEITEGVHVKKNVTCSHCSKISTSFEEKETDVNIAVMLCLK